MASARRELLWTCWICLFSAEERCSVTGKSHPFPNTCTVKCFSKYHFDSTSDTPLNAIYVWNVPIHSGWIMEIASNTSYSTYCWSNFRILFRVASMTAVLQDIDIRNLDSSVGSNLEQYGLNCSLTQLFWADVSFPLSRKYDLDPSCACSRPPIIIMLLLNMPSSIYQDPPSETWLFSFFDWLTRSIITCLSYRILLRYFYGFQVRIEIGLEE
jgi:hypothetical protein